MAQPKDFYEFLVEAELQHYYDSFKNDLKVTSVPQLKYVEEEDLIDMGMTKPEMRRLKKFFKKECPQGTFGKLKRILKGSDATSSSPPAVTEKSPTHLIKSPGGHIIKEEAISVLKTLGTGEFGTVQQGVWTTEEGERVQVAIKCLAKEKMESGMTDFLKEATIMHTISHEYIVRLYGVVLGRQNLMLVTELAPLRSLLECLKEPALRASFSVLQLCDFSQQIADGMAYLENKRFIHRDLAARNILVFAKDKVKISDFGLSRALGVGKDYYQTNFNVNLKLPIAWCAPECINYLKFTSASDVWAYGVTLWEMFSYGFQPWAGFTGQQILDAIDEPECQRLEQPDLCPRGFYELMRKCWEHQPEKRIKFNEIAGQLSLMKPEKAQAIKDFIGIRNKDFLIYKTMDVIIVLDKKPEGAPSPGMWKGVSEAGKVGYFDFSHVAPYIDIKTSPKHKKTKISRKESARKSSRVPKPKLHIGLIGRPENDLRHTGHVGYDGAIFGDVAFIGDSYDKLPLKVVTPTHKANGGSASSLSFIGDADDIMTSSMYQSEISLTSTGTRTESILTGLSTGSHEDTLTDVSSMMSDLDSIYASRSDDRNIDRYEEINDFNDDLDNFKLPDLGLGLGNDLDLGPSFMDEVMKALSSTKESPNKNDTLVDDLSPLIEKDTPFGPGKTSFDNVAMMTENDRVSETDSDKTKEGSNVGSLSSFTSLEAGESKDIDFPPKEEKKKKHKLKLFIPNRDGSKKDRMRTLSASDEKRIDDAIELANEFAQIKTSDHMVSSPKSAVDSPGDLDQNGFESPKPRSGFSLRKKSPRVEKKSFTEEMQSMSSEEILTPEAQEAYNMLVVKGSIKDKDKLSRDRRARRSLDHKESGSERSSFLSRSGRPVNQNIREPQGIPLRGARVDSQENGEEMDTNPLRRLRDSHSSFIPKARLPKAMGGGSSSDMTNGWGSSKKQTDDSEQPNLNANLSFFAKLKEQEMLNEQDPQLSPERCNGQNGEDLSSSSSVQLLQCSSAVSNTANPSTNRIPLPPRVPLKPTVAILNQKPWQRKHPLDLSSYRPVDESRLSGHYSDHASSDTGSDPRLSPRGLNGNNSDQDILNSTHESDDSVFTDLDQENNKRNLYSNQTHIPPISSRRHTAPLSFKNSSHHDNSDAIDSQLALSVKGVKVSASELGYYDNADLFWSKKVNFDDFSMGVRHSDDDSDSFGERDHSPIPGRYKTSDNVSYEDLMEFALDGPINPREQEETVCDEVRLMRRVLSKDVTTEDCMYALEETQWQVHSAIKLIKLKQLLSANLADKDSCKKALMRSQWSVEEAANYLLAHPPGQESPDLVHV